MGAHAEELQVGGRCLLKTRMRYGNGGSAFKTHKAEVIEKLGRASVRVKLEDGTTRTVRYNEVEPDEEWLAEQDAKEREKRARIEREAQLAVAATLPAPPLAAPTMTVTMAEMLRQHEAKKKEPAELRLVPPEAPMKKHKSLPPPAANVEIPEPAPLSTGASTQLAAWLDMGRDVLKPLDEELVQLRKARLQLRDQREELNRQYNANVARTKVAQQQRATIQAVLAGASPGTEVPPPPPEEELAMAPEGAAEALAEAQMVIQALRHWVSNRAGQRWQGAWVKRQVLAILDGKKPETAGGEA